MRLVVHIDIEKSKENLQSVVSALADYEVSSVAWEEDKKPSAAPAARSGQTGGDLGSSLSGALKRIDNRVE